MAETAYLILENGAVFQGKSFGAQGEITGEVVFTTGMTGYIETLTDPSYYGQMILQTFPLIGNYGIIPDDFEKEHVSAKAYIVKHPCEVPSNFRSEGTLDAFLKKQGMIGLCGVDTRMITRMLRQHGVMNGRITTVPPTEADREAASRYTLRNAVAAVSTPKIMQIGSGGRRRVALMDFGVKQGMVEALKDRNCEVWQFPHDTSLKSILEKKPHGILLSNGPGDPADAANTDIIKTIEGLQKTALPIFGICLGHQLLALANGFSTHKLKFGHRGANQPVKDLATGRVYITSQNHGYAVEASQSSFINVNDGTCEGLEYGSSFSVQFHPEARGGPLDTGFLFDRFVERMDAYAAE